MPSDTDSNNNSSQLLERSAANLPVKPPANTAPTHPHQSQNDPPQSPAPLSPCPSCPSDGSAQHGRRFFRYNISLDATLEPTQLNALAIPTPVRINDLSRMGIGFICPHPLPIGSVWRLRFHNDSSAHPIASQCILIAFCHQLPGNSHRIGSQIVLEPWLMIQLGIPPAALRHESKSGCTYPLCATFLPPDSPDIKQT